MKIQLYNLWHNGDVFSGRGYIRELIKQLPEAKFAYYHQNNSKIVHDLVKPGLHVPMQRWQLEDLNYTKLKEIDGIVYINTWVGTYFFQNQEVMKDFKNVVLNLPGEGHANYRSLHLIYQFIFSQLNKNYNLNLTLSDNPLDYVPEINWNYYQIDLADKFVEKVKTPINLFCNGNVKSRQSGLDNMRTIVEYLCKKFPDETFVCTQKFDSAVKNLYFTDDIFPYENDINEIAYLSTKCKMIVGKNSGPFMFTHVKENINNPNKAFVAFSGSVSDCYTHHMHDLPCKYFFSKSTHPEVVCNVILGAMRSLNGSIINLSEI